MPNYRYKCREDVCANEFDTYQSIKAESLKVCPKCECMSIYRVIFPAEALVKADPKTVGLVAERNTQKMGRQMLEEKELMRIENKRVAIKEAQDEFNAR